MKTMQADTGIMPEKASSSDEEQVELLSDQERRDLISHLLKEHPRPQMLSLPIRRRIRALKTLQHEFVVGESRFFKEVHLLECKYEKKLQALAERRRVIVNGLAEPSAEEVNAYKERDFNLGWALDPKALEDVKGIPYFWFMVLRSIPLLAEIITKDDEPVLKHLIDIRSLLVKDPMSFRLEFEFSPNEYFKNQVLYKQYYLSCEPHPQMPFEFHGSEIYKCDAGKIHWKQGKNITVKTIIKKQRHKSAGNVRTVSKTVQARSFFNFFYIPKDNADENDLEKGHQHDYELATYLRERVIPRAILYFTGEAFDNDGSEFTIDEDYEGMESSDDNKTPKGELRKELIGGMEMTPVCSHKITFDRGWNDPKENPWKVEFLDQSVDDKS